MPIFEYVCQKCGRQSEILVRTPSESPVCDCGSRDLKKVFSSFAVTEGHSHASGSCSDGTCGLPSGPSPCASGMCGL